MNKYRIKVLLAQAAVMAEIVSLIFQGVEGFVFDAPTGTTSAHNLVCIFACDREIGNLTEIEFLSFGINLPIFKYIDQKIRVRFIESKPVDQAKGVGHSWFFCLIGLGELHYLTVGQGCIKLFK